MDPYSPFDKNDLGNNFFDVFEKATLSGSKVLLWYGYDCLNGKREIAEHLRQLSDKHVIKISAFDVWLKCMTDNECEINPGVPGCGLACANLSDASVALLKNYMRLMDECYSKSEYCGHNASMLTDTAEY